jgi:hypothetical protein
VPEAHAPETPEAPSPSSPSGESIPSKGATPAATPPPTQVPAVRVRPLPRLVDLSGSWTPPAPAETSDSLWAWSRQGTLWSLSPSLMPSQEALLYRLASGFLSRETLRQRALLGASAQAHEDSMGTSPCRTCGPILARAGVIESTPDSVGYRLFIPEKPSLKGNDLTPQQVTVFLEHGTVEISRLLGQAQVEPTVRMTQEEYLRRLSAVQFRQLWASEVNRGLKATTVGSRRGLARVDIPIALPSQLRGIFGEGKPNLSARGSERISFGGTSRWRPNQIRTEINRKQSKFPQLDMRQDLSLQVTGSIGDKVSVDVDQSSQSTTPLANRIKIHYKGYDDEIIQKVDLGNTDLSLPGTQWVSSGGRSQGLFGINALARLGAVDITTVLSKQEGKNDSKSVTPKADTRTARLDDLSYVAGKYFFLRDPDDCPWDVDENSLSVYVDDQIGSNNTIDGAQPGIATLDGEEQPGQLTERFFKRLDNAPPPQGDYQIQHNVYSGQPVLVLAQPLEEGHVLAVSYSGWLLDANLNRRDVFTVGGAVLPSGRTDLPDTLVLKMIRPARTEVGTNLARGPWAPLRNLELRNIYDLGGRGILKEGFDLRIRLKGTFGDVVDPDRIGDVTFLQMMGLDLSRETSTGRIPGRDDRIDQEFISYDSGLLHFPDLRPFDPTETDLGQVTTDCGDFGNYYRFMKWGQGDSQRQARARALPTSADSAGAYRAPAVYDSVISRNRLADSRFYLEYTFKSPVSKIELNAFGILPGSETVTAGARTLTRDRDYRIDYDMGEVEILEAANVTQSEEIRVTYSYVPFGGGGSQVTLAGASAQFRPAESKLNFSSSWMYQSKGGVPGVEGRRPRLGQEPSRTLVGEFAGTFKSESRLLTSLVDALPGVAARAPSRVDIGFGMGLSLPNPNTKDKLYIDDFDQAKEVLSLTMSRRSWRPSSIPISDLLPGAGLPKNERDALRGSMKGEAWWYSPRTAVQERDLQPTLAQTEGDDNRQVLRVKLVPRGATPEDRKQSWIGLVQVLSTRGADLSRAQFLDVWFNDFRQYQGHPDPAHQRRGKLVIDLGAVSEDAMWYRNDPRRPQDYKLALPNDSLDTEDTNSDLKLDQSSTLNEDVGLDRKEHGTPGADPFDIYQYDDNLSESSPVKYANVNGTEGNQELDSEDLNGNSTLDRTNSYFQIPIDLADSTLWETDVYRDYYLRRADPPSHQLDASNGWRRIRIPLSDSLVSAVKEFGETDPAWAKIFHARIWLTGFEDSTIVELGGIEISGNRWIENKISNEKDREVRADSLTTGESFYVGVVNNKDDAAIYQPPISVTTQNGVTEREQSISINLESFQPGHRASIYRSYSQKQDYTLYENMEFLLNRGFESGPVGLTCAIRLCRDAGSDTTNYYEYRRPVPEDWETVRIDFAALSQLQLDQPDSATGLIVHDLGGGVVMSRRGNPTLTDVKRITFLITNPAGPGAQVLTKGSVWINELRLTSVKKDPGLATRFNITTKLSDIGDLSFSLQRTGADFLQLGADRGSGTTSTNWAYSGGLDFGRFLGGMSLLAPLRTSLSSSKAVPKFRVNSDLTLTKATDRDITQNGAQEISLTLSKRASKSAWARYLVEPFSVGGSLRRATNLQPQSRDTMITRQGTVGWSFPLEKWGNLPLPGTGKNPQAQRMVFRPLPTALTANLSGGNTRTSRSSRTDFFKAYQQQPSSNVSTALLNLSSGMHPITPVNYRIDSSRDLMLRANQQRYFGLNLGRETSRKHSLTASYDPPVLRRTAAPHLTWSGSSNLNMAEQQTAGAEGEPARQNRFDNSAATGYQARLSLADLARSLRSLGRTTAKPESAGAPPAPPPPTTLVTGRGLFGRAVSLGVINMGYNVTKQTSYDRRKGEPDLLYQLALRDIPGSGARALSRAQSRHANSNTLNLDTSLRLPKQINIGTRYSRQRGNDLSNGLLTTNVTRKWPDVDINWGQLHQLLRMDKYFQSFTATTRYSREGREQGTALSPKDVATESTNFSPLLNITTTLRSGLSATVNTTRRGSSERRYRPSLTVTERGENVMAISLKKTVTLTRKIVMPVTNRVQTMQTRLDVNASYDWRSTRAETRASGRAPTVTEDRSSWKLAVGAGYQFTSTISGNGSINFGQDTDRKNESLTSRFIGLTVTAGFTF